MTSIKKTQAKQFTFISNANFQSFDQFRLKKQEQNLINLILHPQDKIKKVKALIAGCIQRNNKLLYKGLKYYIQDLQIILDNYPDITPGVMKAFHITTNKSLTRVCVQCHNCASFTQVWKYCPTCENVHYCHQGCEMKIKFTHERQQCRVRPYPKIYKAIQVEIHVGSDIGKNVHLSFQHQVSMTLLLRGEKLLNLIMSHFTDAQGKGILDDYKIKNENKMIRFEKQIVNPRQQSQNSSISFQSIEEISKIYTDNRILRALQIFLLEKGGILCKNIRQIHDNHLREVFIFHYP